MISTRLSKTVTGELQATASRADSAFRWITVGAAGLILLVVAGILFELVRHSIPSMRQFGFPFLFSGEWDPAREQFTAAYSIVGTLVSSAIAMLIAAPMSLAIALFLVEIAPPTLSRVVGGGIELLAAIPSIIYGMWGMFVFAPLMARYVQPALGKTAHVLPLFSGPPIGLGILTAGFILALMILPFITSVARDVFQMVPASVKESAHGLGATTWEVTRRVVLRYGLRGVVGALFLGLGRALGETMAVTFVIGNNSHQMPHSLFDTGTTIAATLASEFGEAAAQPLYASALIELGLVLFLITLAFQVAAYLWLGRVQVAAGGRA